MKILYYYNLRNRLRTKNEDSTFYLKPPYYAVCSAKHAKIKNKLNATADRKFNPFVVSCSWFWFQQGKHILFFKKKSN